MKLLFILLLVLTVACDKADDALNDVNPVDQFVTKDDTPKESVPVEAIDAITADYMQLINDYRHDLGLDSLTYSKVIETSALGHSQNMANKLVMFGHTGSTARCSVIEAALGGGNLCGEIVAMGQKSPEAAFEAWKNSPGHRNIMINSRYTHTGLGYAINKDGTIYWTQIFLEL